jgi:malate/lactate dehydrogenase
MKLGIIGGGGQLGAGTAFYTGLENIVGEITLVDLNANLAKSHALDLSQALRPVSDTKVLSGGYADLAGSDILLLTAAVPERSAGSRNDYLKANAAIVRGVCAEVKKYCDPCVFITATNPIDVCSFIAYKALCWDRKKFIGFSYNDTLRFRWALSNLLGVPYSGINALCVGEHGEGQVPLFSSIEADGEKRVLEGDGEAEIKRMLDSWFADYQKLNSGRSPGWTSAMGLTTVIRAIVSGGDTVIPCSAVLDGEYGRHGLSIGVPCLLNKGGVRRIVEYPLNETESKAFFSSCGKIQGLLETDGL